MECSNANSSRGGDLWNFHPSGHWKVQSKHITEGVRSEPNFNALLIAACGLL